MTDTPRTIIAHDYFGIRGGGERLVLTLAEALDAAMVYGYRTDESYDDDAFPGLVKDLNLPAAMRRPGLRAAALALRFRLARASMQAYDTRIFSGVAAPFAAPDNARGRNIFYCHTPPRFLYDQQQHFAAMVGQSLPRRLAFEQFRKGYEAAVGRMDVIVANSRTVQERIKTYLGRESSVVYPPCDLQAYRWIEQGDFYLSTARLSGLKRVDMIVRAFLDRPDRRLVVASSGDQLDTLRRLAADAPNISFLGWVDEARLRRLIGQAIATIYVPVDEDFGMSPIESMAAGKPVIGVAEGGLRETIIDGETGTLLPSGFSVADLACAIDAMTPSQALRMRPACEARASEFSDTRFVAGMRALL